MGSRPIFAVDWDGTLVQQRWPEQTREWMPGAVEAMHELLKHGSVFIHSARLTPGEFGGLVKGKLEIVYEYNYIRDMLDSAGLYGVDIYTASGKPYADFYVDDKAVYYAGRRGSWAAITEKMLTKLGVEDTDIPVEA